MTDINRFFVVGRLTRDCELRYTDSGTPLCKFAIAVNESRKKGDGYEDETSFFDCTLWGKMGESLSKYLTKGQQVALDGRLKQNRWEQDGKQMSKIVLNVENVQLLGGKSDRC